MIASLYEDGEILVLDKPAGLAVQPGEGVRISLVDAVERDYGFRPFLVHRLDKETAGLIIVAKDSRSASRWTQALGSREVEKVYRAVASGSLAGERGVLSAPVRVRGESIPARTSWRLLARFGSLPEPSPTGAGAAPAFSYLELELGTGRTHQIRLHLADAGVPILGDDQHGDFRLNKLLRKAVGLKRLLLLSWRLVLPGGRTVTAAMPEQFRDFFAAYTD